VLPSPFTKPTESIKVEIKRPNLRSITVILVYRLSNTKKSFESELELELNRNTENETYLLGDFNIDLLKLSDPTATNLKKLIFSNNFEQVISKPTRVTPTSKSLIDLIILNRKAMCHSSGVLNEVIADHSIIYIVRKKPRSQGCPRKTISTRSFKNTDTDKLKRLVETAPWWILEVKQNIEDRYNLFLQICQHILNIAVPIKKTRVKIFKPYWMTSEFQDISTRVGKLKKQAQKSNSPDKWKEFKAVRNKAFHLKTKIKVKSIKQITEKKPDVNESKLYWKLFNDEIGRSKSSLNIPTIHHDGFLIDDTTEKLNIFNKSFIKGIPIPTKDTTTFQDTECNNTLENLQVTCEDVQFIIKNMEVNKPTGADGLPPIFLKICCDEITPVLVALYNKMLTDGIFPKVLKEAYVFPLYKGKGSRNSVKSYRPISILSCSAKILEKAIYSAINNFLDDPEKLNDAQHGFRRHRSTLSATIRVTDDIKSAGDQRLFTGAVFVDFESAFDLIQPSILLKKLHELGIRGSQLARFQSYFNDRTTRVRKDEEFSDPLNMDIGAPQGSSLSGILFATYINDIMKFLTRCKCVKYADDLVIYYSGRSFEEVQQNLQEDINNLLKWTQENYMKISCGKTKCLLFRPSNLKCDKSLNIVLDNICIDNVSNFRYLGILLESSLNFNMHVDEVCKKMTARMYLINRYKRFFSTKWKKIFATSLIISLSDYALPVRGSLPESSYCRLHKIMTRLGKLVILPFSRNRLVMYDLFEMLNWLDVKERYVLYTLKFIFKHIICESSLTRCFPEFIKLDSATRQKIILSFRD